jgi:enoyl-CoA hydratase/carnithine racemase
MWQPMIDKLRLADADDAVRCVVIRGAGDRAFASGADLSQDALAAAPKAMQATYTDALNVMKRFSKPLIAEIRGYCLGGGLAVAIQADFRIAAQDSSYGIPAVRIGRVYGYDVVARLVSLVGDAQARRMLLVGERFGAEEALRIGLVDELHAPGDLAARIVTLAETIAANAPLAVRGMKCILDEVASHPGEPETPAAREAVRLCVHSADIEEGRRAFVEKRKPNFQGR